MKISSSIVLMVSVFLAQASLKAQTYDEYDTFNAYAQDNVHAFSGDGDLSEDDAQGIIDYLYSGAQTQVSVVLSSDPFAFGIERMDVNDDGWITASDALAVINLLSTNPFKNSPEPNDVNDDGNVTSQDALVIINRLDFLDPNGNYKFRISLDRINSAPYYDVNGSETVTSIDALIVINSL